MARSPSSLKHRILVSTRLCRWQPLQRRQIVQPRRRVARRIPFLACAPGVVASHGRAFLRAGMTARALRAAMAAWQPRVSQAPSALTLQMG